MERFFFFPFWHFKVNTILLSAVYGSLLLLYLAYSIRQTVHNVTHFFKKIKSTDEQIETTGVIK